MGLRQQAQQAEFIQRMEAEFQERLAASIREREKQMRAIMAAQLNADRAETERHYRDMTDRARRASQQGGSGSVTVTPTTSDSSSWTVTGAPSWLTTTKSTNAVDWTTTANNAVSSRTATLSIGGQSYTVTQSGMTGSVSLSMPSASATNWCDRWRYGLYGMGEVMNDPRNSPSCV